MKQKNNLSSYPQDANSHAEPQHKALRQVYGWAGEGQYLALKNRIATSDGCVINLNEDFNLYAISEDLGFGKSDEFIGFIKHLSSVCKLVDYNDGMLTVPELNDVLKMVNNARHEARKRKVGGEKTRPLSPETSSDSEKASSAKKTEHQTSSGELLTNTEELEKRQNQRKASSEENQESSEENQESSEKFVDSFPLSKVNDINTSSSSISANAPDTKSEKQIESEIANHVRYSSEGGEFKSPINAMIYFFMSWNLKIPEPYKCETAIGYPQLHLMQFKKYPSLLKKDILDKIIEKRLSVGGFAESDVYYVFGDLNGVPRWDQLIRGGFDSWTTIKRKGNHDGNANGSTNFNGTANRNDAGSAVGPTATFKRTDEDYAEIL